MSSRKEEERNEKIIRGLLKLPPNRRCINCDSIGPQYVCINFWTFVCITCSGIHREFTHRVKSVSMAKFTSQEVESLQKGGNQRARELYLKEWDLQRQRLPSGSNPDQVREFIKSVYVDKKYVGGNTSEKPPKDLQNHKLHEEEHRRASSYHSYSQSPPYEHQYEERRYGRQGGMLTRKPGSDRGPYEGKLGSFIYSPGRSLEQMYEDRFANEGSAPRVSDYSVSSAGDPLRSGVRSPDFRNEIGFSSPPASREILSEDIRKQPMMRTYSDADSKRDFSGIPRPQRTASEGSFTSFDSNSVSFKSISSPGHADAHLEPVQVNSTVHSPASVAFPQGTPIDFFAEQPIGTVQSSSSVSDPNQGPPLDLFSGFSHQPSSATKPPETSVGLVVDLFADFTHTELSHPSVNSAAPPAGFFAETIHQSSSGAQHVSKSLNLSIDLFSDDKMSAALQPPTSSGLHVDLSADAMHLQSSILHQLTSSPAPPIDLFANNSHQSSTGTQQPETSSVPSVELFTDTTKQPLSNVPSEKEPSRAPYAESEGWATFDMPQQTNLSFETAQRSPATSGLGADMPKEKVSSSSFGASAQWPFFLDSISQEPFPSVTNQLHGITHNDQLSTAPTSSQTWNAFNDSTGYFSQAPSQNLTPTVGPPVPEQAFGSVELCNNSKTSEVLFKGDFQMSAPASHLGLESVASGPSFPAVSHPLMGGKLSYRDDQKSSNPFDFPYGSDPEPSTGFLDMTSFRSALPDPSPPATFFDGVTHSWFPQNSVTPFLPDVPPGGLAYMGGQVPNSQLPNLSSQGPVASLGGNPFA